MTYSVDQLLHYLNLMVGQPYWYGTCCYKASTSLLERKADQYPNWYTKSRIPALKFDCETHHAVTDCVGLIKGFFWTYGGRDLETYLQGNFYLENKYQLDCPDKSADSLVTYFRSKGANFGVTITSIPNSVCVVHKSGHVGVYIGNGEVIESKGFNYGVIRSKLSDTKWTDWVCFPETLIACPPEAEQSEEEEAIVYNVRESDTLWGIAKRYYGDGRKYKKIMEDNGMKSTVIRKGMKLILKGVHG